MSSAQRLCESVGSTLSPITFTPRFSKSGFERATYPSAVVQTGVKSLGWENRTAQLSPIHSWKLIGPSVVSAVKSGAVSPSRKDIFILLCGYGTRRFYNHPRSKSNRHVMLGKSMNIALNGATTMHARLEIDFAAAHAAGFDYVEIWAAKLRAFLQQRSVEELKFLIDEIGVPPLSINSIEHVTFRDET